MYFVVYITKLNKHVVVPYTWIKGIGQQFEKFVNASLNRTQIFICYYTTNEDAFIAGRPNKNYVPNFNVMVDQINPDGSFDGCFTAKLKQYKSELKILFLIMIYSLKKRKIFLKNTIQ